MSADYGYERLKKRTTEEYAEVVSIQRMGSIDQLVKTTGSAVAAQSLSENAPPVVDKVRESQVPEVLPVQPAVIDNNVMDLVAIRAELEKIQAEDIGRIAA